MGTDGPRTGDVRFIHTSAATRCRVKPIQNAVPKNTCGGNPENAKNRPIIGRTVLMPRPIENARIIQRRCKVTFFNKIACQAKLSAVKKKQPYNQKLLMSILQKKITLVDYECLEHEDGQRIIGFGFFAGIVGAHNGMMAYGKRTGAYTLERVYKQKSLRELVHTYFGLKLPQIKIAVTGSGRVASGILEVMNLMGVIEVEADEFLERQFSYPVYVHLKGSDLYRHKITGKYNSDDFHLHPQQYQNTFYPYTKETDILINGVYWDTDIPRLFEWEHMKENEFRIQTIADITDDIDGSIPCNLGDATMQDPVYGVDKFSREKLPPHGAGTVDIMAVGNLPNELPRDASRYFGEQIIKYILEDVVKGASQILNRATIIDKGALTAQFEYLRDYAEGK